MLQQMAASAERVFAFLEAEEEPKTAVTAKTSDISGGVEFNHVHFGYEAGKPIIKDFSGNGSTWANRCIGWADRCWQNDYRQTVDAFL